MASKSTTKDKKKAGKTNNKDKAGDKGSNLIDKSAEEVLTQPDVYFE